MKPTTTIHLAQRLITIESDALLQLQNYLDALKAYFLTQESGEEIYGDIENRVSEIMSNQLKAGAVCITEADLQNIITTVGTLSDLGIQSSSNADATANQQRNGQQQNNTGASHSQQNNKQNPKSKLTRNANDKILSGLCSGIANYFNIDPTWVRIAFVLSIGFGGIGLLAYIIGSFVVPISSEAIYSNKRLMRSLDQKVLGGVCAGLAKYFHTQIINVRLIFLAPILFSIFLGFFDFINENIAGPLIGPSFLIYLMLWLILPYARTTSEKLQMSGEAVNINSIKDNVYGIQDSNASVRHDGILFRIFKAIVFIMIGVFSFIIFASFTSVFAVGFTIQPFTDYFFRNGNQQFLAQTSWILVFGMPLIVTAILIVRALVGIKGWPTYVMRSALLAFGIGIFTFIALASELKKDFKYNSDVQPTEQHIINADSVVLDRSELGNFQFKQFNNGNFNAFQDSLFLENIDVQIVPSADSSYHVSIHHVANGLSVEDANKNADFIAYQTALDGNKLTIPSNFKIIKKNLWRNQLVECTVAVPEGKKIYFTEDIIDKGFDRIQLQMFSMHNWNDNNLEDYDADRCYIMQNGKLKAAYKSEVVNNDANISISLGRDSIQLQLKNLESVLDSLSDNKEKIIDKTKDAIELLEDKLEEIEEQLEEQRER